MQQTQRAAHVHRGPDGARTDIYWLSRTSNNAASRLVAVANKIAHMLNIPVHSIHAPSPSHIHLSISPFGTLTAPDGQVGRLAGAKSPSAAALLPLCGEKGDGYHHGSRYPKLLLNNSSSSAAPHLCLPSTAPARRRSITVYRARPKRPFNYKAFLSP